MYQEAKGYREALKNKARRLAGEPQSDGKTDSSSVKRPSAFTAEGKTGLRPTTRRAYKKGGAVRREEGGRLPPPEEAMESEARQKNIRYKDSKMPSPQEAAERSGKTAQDVPGRKKGGKAEVAKKRMARARGGVTSINIGRRNALPPQAAPQAQANAAAPAPMMAPPGAAGAAPGAAGPMPGAMPGAAGGMPAQMPPPNQTMPAVMPQQQPIGLKTGGRATKVARSYKDMRAGAGSGEGRLQKTDIAKQRRA